MFLVKFLPDLFGTSSCVVVRLLAHSSTGTERKRSQLPALWCLGAHWTWENAGGEWELSLFCSRAALGSGKEIGHVLSLCHSYACALVILMLVWFSGLSLVSPSDLDFSLTLVTVAESVLLFFRLGTLWSQGTLEENSGEKPGKRISEGH